MRASVDGEALRFKAHKDHNRHNITDVMTTLKENANISYTAAQIQKQQYPRTETQYVYLPPTLQCTSNAQCPIPIPETGIPSLPTFSQNLLNPKTFALVGSSLSFRPTSLGAHQVEGKDRKAITETIDFHKVITEDEASTIKERIKQFTKLLDGRERPTSLILPTSLGYTQHNALKFTILYELPSFADSTVAYRSLYTLFPRNPRSVTSKPYTPILPCLEDRFKLAQALSASILPAAQH
ncbi:hypothetical protein B0O99DRAFT_748016 [Bisporella sp. PMI_857]|nr:hypothetical protein B0O99DRAFT_748016 [Bisporella sp. PMI_857]